MYGSKPIIFISTSKITVNFEDKKLNLNFDKDITKRLWGIASV
jgi:hypothetical protein